jgi:hypothetical protein
VAVVARGSAQASCGCVWQWASVCVVLCLCCVGHQVLRFVGRAIRERGASANVVGVILDEPRDTEKFKSAKGFFGEVRVLDCPPGMGEGGGGAFVHKRKKGCPAPPSLGFASLSRCSHFRIPHIIVLRFGASGSLRLARSSRALGVGVQDGVCVCVSPVQLQRRPPTVL